MDKHGSLTHFIKRIVSDSRLKPVHISLSIALCHSWMLSQFQHSYRISRRILMKASRIRSKATYHKTLKELQMYGYIKYLPSYWYETPKRLICGNCIFSFTPCWFINESIAVPATPFASNIYWLTIYELCVFNFEFAEPE